MPEEGLSDEQLLGRLRALYPEAVVAEVARELAEAQKVVAAGMAREGEEYVRRIHRRHTYRMHDLSEFMKTLLQRFTRWHNKRTRRSGNLWEETFKSVMVEDGVAARTMAAYIDLNPVRAGMVADPAAYRWSSYGEAIGGGPRGNGKTARAGLVRACMSHEGAGFEAEKWKEASLIYRRLLGLALERKGGPEESQRRLQPDATGLPDLGLAGMLRCRVRYFTDGAVIGSRGFVNAVFEKSRERFAGKRKDGARKPRGNGRPAAGVLWSLRDLQVDV